MLRTKSTRRIWTSQSSIYCENFSQIFLISLDMQGILHQSKTVASFNINEEISISTKLSSDLIFFVRTATLAKEIVALAKFRFQLEWNADLLKFHIFCSSNYHNKTISGYGDKDLNFMLNKTVKFGTEVDFI